VTMKNAVFCSEELSVTIIRVTKIVEQGITLAVTSNRRTLQCSPILVTLMIEVLSSSERRLQKSHGVISQKTIFPISSQRASVSSYW
jgi:hypothetical protein